MMLTKTIWTLGRDAFGCEMSEMLVVDRAWWAFIKRLFARRPRVYSGYDVLDGKSK